MKSIFWRVVLVASFTVLAVILFLPSTPLKGSLPKFWADNVPKIVLGLDLQGGMHLVLKVEREKAVESYLDRVASTVDNELKDKKVAVSGVTRNGNSLVVAYTGGEAESAIKEFMKDTYVEFKWVEPEKPAKPVDPSASAVPLVFALTEEAITNRMENAHQQAIEVIRNRIDQFGVAEPLVTKHGNDEILVQLPGIKDAQRAKDLIGKTAMLEFRLVDETRDPREAERVGAPYGSVVVYEKSFDAGSRQVTKTPYLVRKETLLTGESVADARVAFDQLNDAYVGITFDAGGAKTFERITERNVGKRLAIMLDGNVYSAPVIKEAIAGGNASISGGFTVETASDLALVLRAGSLPAPVTYLQTVTVGPSLGKDSIEAGIKAMVVGALLVLIFMVIYYKISGIIADFAVLLNVVMLLGAMAAMNATLTLPGIAGIILTVGMGVDSNVLIFERIREELRAGRTPRSAINAGYDRAWWTVVDSHVTTLITGMILFQFGSGPIKGFAVSLCLGILINLFTALVGTKFIFDLQAEKLKIDKVSI
ncbi:MAG: protein translocase subunit SecD [Deltaproteobacteria bacterium]|nr:protein translocase subunit SecD [Deltaproteobacteria bacterium]